MITINFKRKDDKFISLNVKGHANFADFGEDVVCAGVSSIVFGALNAFDRLAGEHFKIDVSDEEVNVEAISDVCMIDKLLSFVYIQLLTIENQYPDNITIIIK